MLTSLFRVKQWYKNLVVFLPLFFVGLATDINSIILTFIGFLALCLMSSSNYILNDIIDIKKDKSHPEKKLRPLPSGKLSITLAGTIALFLATISQIIAIKLSLDFFYIILIFFFLTQSYSLFLKKELFVDIILISTNFVLRAISGAYILDVRVSPWLVICTFFLALFIATGKRKADNSYLKEKASKHKQVLLSYTPSLTNALMILSTGLLILSYSLYSFLSIYPNLIYALPFSLYVILRYYYLIESHSTIARNPELFYKDKRLVLGILLWTISVFTLIYFT